MEGPLSTQDTSEESQPKSKMAAVVPIITAIGFGIAFKVPELRTFAWGGIAGMLIGIWPNSVASKRGQSVLANVSFFLCFGLGIAGGLLLSVPAAIVMVLVSKYLASRRA